MNPLLPWLRNAIIILFLFEIIYLAVINLALSLPVTQTLINQIKPDKFAVSWEKAWSWYPFRVHATGVSANGQTGTQQWQLDSPLASASISLIPLIWKSVNLSSADVSDAVFHLRPRPRTDKDHSKIRPYFAPIENRKLETEPVPVAVKKKGKSWDISVDDIHASGSHRVWVYQLQTELNGELQADINFRTRGGPFSLNDGVVDVNIGSITINGDREVVRNGHIKGALTFSPFVPKENKGIKALEFLSVDADIKTETESLAFLNFYIEGFYGMEVAGRGNIDGHLNYQLGKLKAGNKVLISANELAVDLLAYRAQGEGEIRLEVTEAEPDVMDFEIKFGELDGLHAKSNEVLVRGDGITFSGKGRTQLLPVGGDERIASYLAVNVPSIKVPELASYQRFIPPAWQFKFHGGEGELQGKAELTQTGFSGTTRLTSTAADVGIKGFQFLADLDINMNVDAPEIADSGVDVSGSYVRIDNARLSNEDATTTSEPWKASFEIEQGRVKLLLPDGMSNSASIKELFESMQGREILPMLDSDSEKVKLHGMISDLRWLKVLLKNRFNLDIKGSGDITADVVIASGWPAPGTELNIKPQKLVVEVLDYIATGSGGGHLKLAVVKGGESPDVSLDVKMSKASFRSKDDEEAFIEDTDILLLATARNISVDGAVNDVDLHLQIPSALVKDMSVYNTYLPPDSPLQILDGQAELKADVMLKPESAAGYVRLVSSGMHSLIDDQELEAELIADIKLVGGVPENMDFDIASSSVEIKNVKVTGNQKSFDDDNWGVLLTLNKARAVWKKPVQLDLEADLEMTDSRPFVAMIANQKGKEGWLEKAMTIDDVSGEVKVNMKQDIIVIPYAFAVSDKIDVGAKAIISADARNGVLYARFKKLHGLLKINNGKRNLDILKAREKFDAYVPDKSLLTSE